MVKELENLEARINWHWRDSMRIVRFFNFDGRCAILVPIWLLYLRTSTLILTVIVLFIFNYLEKKGLSFPAALRALRVYCIGRYRPGTPGVLRHKFIDYG